MTGVQTCALPISRDHAEPRPSCHRDCTHGAGGGRGGWKPSARGSSPTPYARRPSLGAGSPARQRCLSRRARAAAAARRWICASHPASSALPDTFLRSPTPGTRAGRPAGRSGAPRPQGSRAEPAGAPRPPPAHPRPARHLRGGVPAAAPPQVARAPARRRPGAPGKARSRHLDELDGERRLAHAEIGRASCRERVSSPV